MTAVITADPKQLVEAYKQGDAQAFDEIVRCYYEGLFSHAVRRLGDAHAAEDAVQETLVRAYGALHRFNGDYHLRAWLHRILSNVCHDEGARRQRELRTVERVAATEVDLVVDESGEDLIDRLAIPRLQVLDALAGLPEPYRDALVLRYVNDLSFREVAEATGVTEGNARARVHRARAALRRTLGASLALLAWIVPVLRRAERTAAADGAPSVHAGLAASHATPVLSRAVDAGLAERVASLAGSLGIAATLAVPVGVSQVADQVKPASAPPAAVEGETAGAPDDRPRAVTVAPQRTAVTTRTTVAAPQSSGAAPSTTATSVSPAAAPARAAAGPSLLASGETTGTSAPGSSDRSDSPAPGASPAPAQAASRAFVLESNELTATTSWRTDVAGRVRVRIGDQVLPGNLVGVLEAERRQAPSERRQAPSESGTAPGAGTSTASSSPSSTTTTQAPPPEPQPRKFSSDLTVRFDDGRVIRLRVTGTLTDGDGDTKAAGDVEVFDEVCGVGLGVAELAGSLALREAPLMSSLALTGDGVALADAKSSRSDCAGGQAEPST